MTLKNFLKKVKLSERTISAVLGVLVVVVAGTLLFNFFQSRNEAGLLNGGQIAEEGQQEKQIAPTLPTTHRVDRGENLWRIAESYYGSGYNWVDIAQTNSLKNANLLLVGQELLIPDVAVRWPETDLVDNGGRVNTYTVQSGDSLWKIAMAVYGDGYQWTNIYQANEAAVGSNPGLIYAGQVLVMP
ncbi:MAG: LysM peptidoglycan-binding domain-containing protein [Candidatus Shapirobacteria bacterium]|nr:LysM peptidoglycan-binding domain-containing protein [Candidatus Shapirobacteria bacterium]MDD5073727.1 LysM peptidoglycan-binding domain-containing protein [Candidatus Shapirobacteria bacterium]MDD5481716.1 LysM peptidoglycan-binding domain-containing protein [Candidatus Shapirobacteria bacterium]